MNARWMLIGISVLGSSIGGCHSIPLDEPPLDVADVKQCPSPRALAGRTTAPSPPTSHSTRRNEQIVRKAAGLETTEPRLPGPVVPAGHDVPNPPEADLPRPPEPAAAEPPSLAPLRGSVEGSTEARHDSPQSLEQFETLGLRNNPSVSEAQARVSALRGKWLQVGLYPNPTAGYVASEVGNEGDSGQQGGLLGQEMVTGGKLRLNRAVVSQEVRRAQQELAAQRYRVLTDVRIAYYDVLIAQRRIELTGSLLETTTRAAETVEKLFRAKEATRPDLLQAQVETDGARLLAQNAETIYAATWQRLVAVVGCPGMMPVSLVGDIEETPSPLDLEAARHRILGSSPQLAAAMASVDRSRWAIRQARAQVVPNVDLQTTVQRDDSTGDTITGVQATLPIPILNRNQGGIRQAQSELTASQRAIERLELSLERKLSLTYQRYGVAQQQVDQYSREILPKIRDTLSLVNENYRGGEASFLQLLTAQRTYVQTNLTYLDSLRELWAAFLEIEGLLLRDSLDQPPSAE